MSLLMRSISNLFVLALSFHVLAGFACSQTKQKERKHFIFQTIYGIGLTGTKVSHRAVKVDENGFAYDLKSLLVSGGRGELGVSDDQYLEITKILDGAVQQMKESPERKLFLEDQSDLEEIFVDAERKAFNVLTDQQIQNLTLFRHKKGIQKVGLAGYLTSSHFGQENNLSKVQVTKLKLLEKSINNEIKERTLSIRRNANKELLDACSDVQKNKLKNFFGKRFNSEFLNCRLFVKNPPSKKLHFPKRKTFLQQVLKLKKYQRKLSLTNLQKEELKTLEQEKSENLLSILEEHQLGKLKRLTTARDLKTRGTVITLSTRYLSSLLKFTEEQSHSVYEKGLEIHSKVSLEIRKIEHDVYRENAEKQSGVVRQRMLEIFNE